MATSESLIEFPCSFPLKVMGRNQNNFVSLVQGIVAGLLPANEPLTVEIKPSSGDAYVSVTLTFTAQSKDQLDALYQQLHASPLVLMTL
jgi:putative lipoic acid-binding regulatory protein